jgi:uncharacterized protein YdhG (YjbR/CyaY superfamily)
MKDTTKTARRASAAKSTSQAKRTSAAKKSAGFSDFEKAAMKERAAELKTESRRGSKADKDAGGEADVLAAIAAMPKADRVIGERIHVLVKAASPDLSPRTWYGMPAYARGEKVVCFFQGAAKFKARYATLGFSDQARLDEGDFWATSFAVKELTPATEAKIAALVKKAVG